jgi:acyl-CoA thioesterase-2
MPEAIAAYFGRERPIVLRPVDLERYMPAGVGGRPPEPVFNVWLRAAASLPDDPALHRAVLAYASDMTLLDVSLIPHRRSVFDPTIQAASLDHALWFHRPVRVDDWLLYAQDSPAAGGARGFARGQIFDQAGNLVASVAQEGLIRPVRD